MAKIAYRHMYHGSALTQIAEHEEFTSINRVPLDYSLHRSAFEVNEGIGIFLKYATSANGEYQFTFSWENLADVEGLNDSHNKTYILLVCLEVDDDARLKGGRAIASK